LTSRPDRLFVGSTSTQQVLDGRRDANLDALEQADQRVGDVVGRSRNRRSAAQRRGRPEHGAAIVTQLLLVLRQGRQTAQLARRIAVVAASGHRG